MNVYRWSSKALKNYTRGHIVAMGVDVEQARATARKHFDKFARSRWDWLYSKYPDVPLDEEDRAELADNLAQLELDILQEPEECDVFFIHGGE